MKQTLEFSSRTATKLKHLYDHYSYAPWCKHSWNEWEDRYSQLRTRTVKKEWNRDMRF